MYILSTLTINPFGEAYPELGNAEGTGFRTIMSYIQDGGILINSGGQPFVYSWNVNTGDHKLLVSFIPTLSTGKGNNVEETSIIESLVIPYEALLLKRHFNVETDWDQYERGIVGEKEVDMEFDELLGHDKQKTKAKVYRPVKELSHSIQPLIHSYSDKLWGGVYPVVAVKFGSGFLIHTGMSLDEEREYKILLDIISRLSLVGYETLAKFV